jgi:REP element-mobilizing transposase RayT
MTGMPRLPRFESTAGLYHVYARGVRRLPIFVDDRDRWRYLGFFARVTERVRWRCLSYCLMGNHMHLLIETREPNLGVGMHRLHGSYAQYFNRRYGHSGHLFKDRYDAVPIQNDAQLWLTAAYIARNPVKAGLCRTPGDWRWGSHAAIEHDVAPKWLDVNRLWAYFGAGGGDGRQSYLDLVEALEHDLKKG